MEKNKTAFLEPELSLLEIHPATGPETTTSNDVGSGDNWDLPEL